jgi:hypothetical protein
MSIGQRSLLRSPTTFKDEDWGQYCLGNLPDVAAVRGIHIFEAEVVVANGAMLRVFRESGFPLKVEATAGQLHVTFPTSFSEEAIKRFEQRETLAAVNALKLFFNPRAVAVIGASLPYPQQGLWFNGDDSDASSITY